jgi:hypothetical protein
VRDPLEDWIRKDAALAGTFSVQQPVVDRTRGLLQVAQVVQAAADPRSTEIRTRSFAWFGPLPAATRHPGRSLT